MDKEDVKEAIDDAKEIIDEKIEDKKEIVEEKIEDAKEVLEEKIEETKEEIKDETTKHIFDSIGDFGEWLENSTLKPMMEALASLAEKMSHQNERLEMMEQTMRETIVENSSIPKTLSEANMSETNTETPSSEQTENPEKSAEENPVEKLPEEINKNLREIVKL